MVESIEIPAACNQVFNVGADRPYTIIELAGAVAQAMGVEPKILHLPARNEVINAYSSHEKVQRVFGPRRLHTLEEGLGRMAEWVKAHGARTSQKFENIEVQKNFPKAWLS
jgi:UDP-glucose 4-epimerase